MTRRLTPSQREAREAARNFRRSAIALSRQQQKRERDAQRQAARDLKRLQKLFKNKPRPRRGPLAYQFRKLSGRARGIKRDFAREYASQKHRAEIEYGTSSVRVASAIRRYRRITHGQGGSAFEAWAMLHPTKAVEAARIIAHRAQAVKVGAPSIPVEAWLSEFESLDEDMPITAIYYHAL